MTSSAVTFTPSTRIVGSLAGRVPTESIEAEPMLFSASPSFAREQGGPLTQAVLGVLEGTDEIEEAAMFAKTRGLWLVIDTRSHMLMPGFCPAIPGWHCDAYPRRGYASQPDVRGGTPDAWHYVTHLSDQDVGPSRTIFADEPLSVDIAEDDRHVWKTVHDAATARVLRALQFLDGEVVRFSQPTLHRVAPAECRGWRWWFRMSMYYRPPLNRIRRQVQVYTTEGGGW